MGHIQSVPLSRTFLPPLNIILGFSVYRVYHLSDMYFVYDVIFRKCKHSQCSFKGYLEVSHITHLISLAKSSSLSLRLFSTYTTQIKRRKPTPTNEPTVAPTIIPTLVATGGVMGHTITWHIHDNDAHLATHCTHFFGKSESRVRLEITRSIWWLVVLLCATYRWRCPGW